MRHLICGPHQNSAACCRIREGYGLAHLNWKSEQYRPALADIVQANHARPRKKPLC